ncbi:hypothetical protein ACSV4D_15830 [Flavobacterium sp. ARAG 55.4]|uniref:Lipoprotein n=1 Tax=Flavobacterium plantiphilum TaxID=3163297 RepID=A0ABW8XYR4_9FLAO
MKVIYILSNVVLFVILASSCMNKKTDQVVVAPQQAEAPIETPKKECYQAVIEKDTLRLTLDINTVNDVNGELDASYFEKDRSFGTLLGNMRGDTIFADYKFESEGKTSIREMAFIKKDSNTYVEGHGEMIDANDRMAFKDKSKIKFDGNIVYHKINCE